VSDQPFAISPRKTCRVCGSGDLYEVLDLGEQYVSDFVEPGREKAGIKCPIVLDLCGRCTLVQQRYTAPQDFLYTRHYWYRSGVTETMRAALKDIVQRAGEVCGSLQSGDVVLDIGSNDGTLLRCWDNTYRGELVKVGVEPAKNLATLKNYSGLHLINEFWSFREYSRSLAPRADADEMWPRLMGEFNGGKAKVVTAVGMFYDLEDPNQFVADVAKVLHPDGLFVAQLQCLKQTVELRDVGNFCHEHLEFYSLRSLLWLFQAHGLEVTNLEQNAVNGGSYRLYARHRKAVKDWTPGRSRVEQAVWQELALGLGEPETYAGFAHRLQENRQRVLTFLDNLNPSDRVWVYGASTKGNVILQWLGLDKSRLQGAADRSPEKWGKVTAGSGVAIHSEDAFRAEAPEWALVMPYAFLDEFVRREQEWMAGGGRFVVPVPELKVV